MLIPKLLFIDALILTVLSVGGVVFTIIYIIGICSYGHKPQDEKNWVKYGTLVFVLWLALISLIIPEIYPVIWQGLNHFLNNLWTFIWRIFR